MPDPGSSSMEKDWRYLLCNHGGTDAMRKLGMFLVGFAAVLFAGGVARAAMMADEDTDNKFTIHGEVRFRGEYWDNLTDFTNSGSKTLGAQNGGDNFDIFPYRVRLAA